MPFHVQAVFGNDFPVLGRSQGLVAYVPREGFKDGVNQRLADLGFVDAGGEKCLAVGSEVLTEPPNFFFALLNCLARARLLHLAYGAHKSERPPQSGIG